MRFAGNKAIHEVKYEDLVQALNVHKAMYFVAAWFVEVYGMDQSLIIPEYAVPPISKISTISEADIQEIVLKILNEKKIASTQEQFLEDDLQDGMNSEVEKVPGFLQEFTRLRESSMEAVMSANQFSTFKKYMHIERPIQKILTTILEEEHMKPGASLVMVCGSVGDGKSHILGYLNDTRPDIMNAFNIHNDATESFDPKKDALDTLREVLDAFTDVNIVQNNSKLILAINLGILNNFMESKYISEFTKLKAFIEEIGVFGSEKFEKIKDGGAFRFVHFGQYQLYEVNNGTVKSAYLDQLFERIFKKDVSNPFYKEYLADVKNGVSAFYLTNYELMCNGQLQEYVKKLVARVVIEHKQILSPRTLMNFIYDLIVPEAEEVGNSIADLEDSIHAILYNRLFSLQEKSELLMFISKYDPINHRSQQLDMLLLELYNVKEISEIFRKYVDLEHLDSWLNMLRKNEISGSIISKALVKSFIRMHEINAMVPNEQVHTSTFDNYINYLCGFKEQKQNVVMDFYRMVEKVIREWNGHYEEVYLFDQNVDEKVRLAYKLKLESDFGHLKNMAKVKYNSDKYIIVVGFKTERMLESLLLEIDYPLFEMIERIYKGYRPNKKNREDALKLNEYVDSLIDQGADVNEILFDLPEHGEHFKLMLINGFLSDEYKFKRG